jgi:hypothetical protein
MIAPQLTSYKLVLCVQQDLQEKFCKAEQDCFGAPGTGCDFPQNWGFELKNEFFLNKTSTAKD